MNEKLELLIANINKDLKSIDKLRSEYEIFLKSINYNEPDTYQKAVIGYYLHNFYNACESIFLTIAKAFENNIDPTNWHKDILKRMLLHVEGIRPPVIGDETFKVIDDFRAFRHVFRHVYSFELDWKKQKIVADQFFDAITRMNQSIETFIAKIR